MSLLLLTVTNIAFGWLLFDRSIQSQMLAAGLLCLIAFCLTAPFASLRSCLNGLFQSDTRAFAVAILAAFGTVVLLSWLQITARILVLFSAAALVRLDLQISGFNRRQAFAILTAVSLVGFGLGIFVHLAAGVKG